MFAGARHVLSRTLRLAATRRQPPLRQLLTSPLPNVTIMQGPSLDFIYQNVDAYGDRPALIDGLTGQRVLYSDLRRLTANVSGALVGRGFGRGQTLTIFASNCWESVVVYHGVLATGGLVNLVNCHSTVYELSHHLRKVQPSLMVVTADRLEVAAAALHEVGKSLDIYVIGEDQDEHRKGKRWCLPASQLLDGGSSGSVEVDINGDDAVVLPHSSGTSGMPKTVMLSHNNLRANVAQAEVVFDLSDGRETFLACLPFYHIYSPVIVYSIGLRRGATFVILPRFEPDDFLRCIQQFKVTYLHLVPPLVLFLTKSPEVKRFDLRSVTQAFAAAAPLHPETHMEFVNQFREKQPEFDFVQGYGMTELTPLCHVTPRRHLRPSEKAGSVGVLVPNTKCRVLNLNTGQEVGPGEEGEIVIQGPQIMKGYLDDPGATSQLIRDEWVFTGDVGYYDEDEYFYITDRVKELIKYKGIPVAPAELEAFLLTHPAVADAGVVGKKDERAGELPTAFVVRSGEISEKELHHFVQKHLNKDKWLRGGIHFVDEIPKSPSGKILRRFLRERLNS